MLFLPPLSVTATMGLSDRFLFNRSLSPSHLGVRGRTAVTMDLEPVHGKMDVGIVASGESTCTQISLSRAIHSCSFS